MTIEIILNGTLYQLKQDSFCFTVLKKTKTKEGKEAESRLGYPTKLSQAVHIIIKNSMADIDETISLMEYVERYELALKDCRQTIDF